MSGWRHVEHYGEPAGVICTEVVEVAGYICGCTTPTPDPTSPCGWALAVDDEPCGDPANSYWHEHIDCHDEDHDHCDVCHPHVPTRCTCGHPVEAVP